MQTVNISPTTYIQQRPAKRSAEDLSVKYTSVISTRLKSRIYYTYLNDERTQTMRARADLLRVKFLRQIVVIK